MKPFIDEFGGKLHINTRVAFDGVVNDPMKMGGVDLRLKFSGDSLYTLVNWYKS